MQPGQYFVGAGNPAMKDLLKRTITVAASSGVSPTVTPSPGSTLSENATVTTTISATLTQKINPKPSAAPISPVVAFAGLVFAGIIAMSRSNCKKNNNPRIIFPEIVKLILRVEMKSTRMYIGIRGQYVLARLVDILEKILFYCTYAKYPGITP